MLILEYAPETLFIPLVIFLSKYKKVALIVLLILLFIFRKGDVNFDDNPGNIASPAEGVVERISREGDFINISIFLNPINRHFQISPVSGFVDSVIHIPGEFDMAYNKISTSNERVETTIKNKEFDIVVVRQIAGYLFRRIVNVAKQDELVKKGDFLGLIKFSSKVEILVPVSQGVPIVKVGDKVNIGDTIFSKSK